MARSYAELMGLEFEAERLVRCGESRAEVSRRLGVHPQTLAAWALRGGWRKKDLDLERSREATHKTLQAIRAGNRAADAQAEMRVQLAVLMREAVGLLADGGEEALGRLDRMLAGIAEPGRLEAPKVVLGPDRLAGGMRSLGEIGGEGGVGEDGVGEDGAGEDVTDDGEAWSPEVQRRVNRERGRG